MAALGLDDYQIAIRDVILGPGTPYLVHDYSGFGVGGVRSNDIPRSMDDGDYYGVDTLDSKTVDVPITVTGETPEETMANRTALMAAWWLRDGEDSIPLSVKLPGLPELFINGRPRTAPSDLSRLLGRIIKIPLEFFSADPVFYKSDATVVNVVGTLSNTVTNGGIYAARPVLVVEGPAIGTSIMNVTQGKTLTINTFLDIGDFLTIRTDDRTIYFNGTDSVRSDLDPESDWWTLDPGASTISCSDGYLTVTLNDPYL